MGLRILFAILLAADFVAGQQTSPLVATIPPAVSKASVAGALDSSRTLRLALSLPLRNQSELNALIAQLYDPASPSYRQYLSAGEFTARFGPAQADYDAVVRWARSKGLTIAATTSNRRIVDVTGSVAAINRALRITLRSYKDAATGREFFAADREPVLDLPVQLHAITGLTNANPPVAHHHQGPVAEVSGSGPGGTFLPSDLRAAYYGAGPLTGAGQTVGIFSYDGYLSSDLQVYYSTTGMTTSVPVTNVPVAGFSGACFAFNPDGSVNYDECDDAEQILDIVNVLGMAPGLAEVLFYEGSSATDILNQMAADNVAKVISSSWGGGDFGDASDPSFQEFQAQGQTYLSASGDSGEINYQFYVPPGADPNITQVGATDLVTNGADGSWSSETGWSQSGGGYVNFETIPSYQQTTGVINSSNQGSTTLRNTPDVAAEGNYDNTTVVNGIFQTGFGGTSYAAPRWAGLIALANQQSLANGNGYTGFLNPTLYNLGLGGNYQNQFHDITSGTNSPPPGYGNGFNAVAGYDLVTGWGSPNGPALIAALAGQPTGTPSFGVTVYPVSLSLLQGTTSSVVVSSNATGGGFASDVSLTLSGVPSGVTATLSSGTISGGAGSATLTLAASAAVTAGPATITVTATGGGMTHTTTIAVEVIQTPTVTLTSAANPSIYGQSVNLTATVSPAADSGSIAFYNGVSVLGTAQLSGGSAKWSGTFFASGSQPLRAVYTPSQTTRTFPSAVLAQVVASLAANGFQPFQANGIASGLQSMATADFNGDSIPDLAVGTSGGVYLLVGNGDGTFQSPMQISDADAYSLAAADLNGDGRTDLVIGFNSGATEILLGNGNGTFGTGFIYPSGSDLNTVAVADFNGDGKPDIAVGSTGVGVLLGNGDGTFQSEISNASTGKFQNFAVGDFNGDGKADIVESSGGVISVMLGNGDGTLLAGASYTVGSTSNVVAAADLNADGRLDLVVATGAGLAVLMGNGDGTFQKPAVYGSAQSALALAVGDLNGDGNLDVAWLDSNAGLLVFFGNGDGSFDAPVTLGEEPAGLAVVLSDFNRDGRPDVAMAGNNPNSNIEVMLGKPVSTSTTTKLTSSLNPDDTQQAVTLTAAVSPSSATGTITFSIGIATPATVPLQNGVATYTVTNLPEGADLVTAVYGGDSSHGSSSAALTEQVACAVIAAGPLFADSNGGSQTLSISATSPSCAWTASTESSWIQLSASSGSGSGTLTVTLAANTTGADLSGTVSFGSQAVAITQRSNKQVFTDVPPSSYYFDAVNLMAAKTITNGCGSTTYCPLEAVTRAQMAVFIVRTVMGGDDFTYSQTPYFTDVPEAAFGFKWIQKMKELGITAGCGANTYCPNSPVTRAQMAVFIIRARYGSTTAFDYPPEAYFSDVPPDAFGYGWIQRMREDNITSGCSLTAYCPNNAVIRGDMAIFIMRGGFNQLLPPAEPILTAVSPATLSNGATVNIAVTGQGTHFAAGSTVVNGVAGIQVNSVTVNTPTSLTLNVTGNAAATPQPVSIWVTTGAEEAVIPNGLTIQ